MSFTYDHALGTDRDWVRLMVGDITENQGLKPDKANFSDEEIAGLLAAESLRSRAVAACYEVLASLWAVRADVSLDDYRESCSQISARYAALAKLWRDKHGFGVATMKTTAPMPVDGYSQDIAVDEVEASTTEYAAS